MFSSHVLRKALRAAVHSSTTVALAFAAGGPVPAAAAGTAQASKPDAACHADADWDQPAPPRRVFGNVWFVGTCGITSLLVTTKQGHILLDGTTEKGGALVEANIRRLGFRVKDVHYILTSHAHSDHAGGTAKIQNDSGATVVSRGADADALRRGHGDRSDPQFVIAKAFAPVANVRAVADGERIELGGVSITAHATPGHTSGSTSWTWDACEEKRCVHVVYADSLSAIADDDYRYGDDAAHPGTTAAFRASIASVAALPCDILLTPHPDASDLWERLGASATRPLIDSDACRRYAKGAQANFDKRLAKERGEAK